VVNDILNISLIEANEMRLQQESVNMAEVINAALQELNPVKNDRILNNTLQNLDTLPTIIGDEDRLRQAFWNILSNAIKYTPDGGSISVEGWLNSANPGEASSSIAEERGMVIVVTDSGIGIDRSELQDIFNQFYVVGDTSYHSSSKTALGGGGTGLGLPITRGIIEAHGGRVWAESQARDPQTCPGSKFYVILPLESPPA
jgi:signal transduction histidine kinase